MPSRALITSYEQDVALFPDRWHKIGLVAAVLVLAPYPFIADSHWLGIGNLVMVTVVGAVSLMILTGFTGQISLGHAAFLAVGGYTAAIAANMHIPVWIIFPLAGLLAAAAGMLVGPFALRLQGLYLAIVTIGLLFLVRHVLLSFPELTGGVSGISVPVHMWFGAPSAPGELSSFTEDLTLLGVTFTFERKLYFMFLPIAVATVLAATNIRRSDIGRTLMAVRDHDQAASALGVNPARVKMIAFATSSFFAGIAGAMFAFQQQYITVDPFDLNMSVMYIAVIILGGMGTVFGAVAGAVFFCIVGPLAEIVGRQLPGIKTLSSAQQSTLLFSVAVIAFLLFEAFGLFGIWMRIKRYFMAWPFRY